MFINKKNTVGRWTTKPKQKPYAVIEQENILKMWAKKWWERKKNGNATDDKQQLAIDATWMITFFCAVFKYKLIAKQTARKKFVCL